MSCSTPTCPSTYFDHQPAYHRSHPPHNPHPTYSSLIVAIPPPTKLSNLYSCPAIRESPGRKLITPPVDNISATSDDRKDDSESPSVVRNDCPCAIIKPAIANCP
ncbi:hypothetical protein TrLO_g5297 [Triparma laevis f. longispina]|uniref:Uncharacterized protein n=1 Tax=Triparma laevis f. longispina TaxID=1714387 RepID=A0A9W7FCN4_9STRA|nr:hypothetical protein TrLO_g5297 [Triparma laevis f. longispina]